MTARDSPSLALLTGSERVLAASALAAGLGAAAAGLVWVTPTPWTLVLGAPTLAVMAARAPRAGRPWVSALVVVLVGGALEGLAATPWLSLVLALGAGGLSLGLHRVCRLLNRGPLSVGPRPRDPARR